jgi:hypothetical protein
MPKRTPGGGWSIQVLNKALSKIGMVGTRWWTEGIEGRKALVCSEIHIIVATIRERTRMDLSNGHYLASAQRGGGNY